MYIIFEILTTVIICVHTYVCFQLLQLLIKALLFLECYNAMQLVEAELLVLGCRYDANTDVSVVELMANVRCNLELHCEHILVSDIIDSVFFLSNYVASILLFIRCVVNF